MAKPSREEADRRLKAAIDAFSETAYGSDTDPELSESRALAIERYLGRNIDPAPVGRSQVRDRTTFEVVEWTKPSLLRIFTSGNEVCRFDPQGPEDEEQAEQETDYVNYVITQRNNWHQVCNDWFSDALLLKNGYAYAYWDESKTVESEFYENLTDDAFALIAQDKEVEVVAHEQRPNEELDARNAQAFQQAQQQYAQQVQQMQMQAMQTGQPFSPPQAPQPPQPTFLHDCEIKRVNRRGQVKLCTIAPERCLVDVDAPDHTLMGANYFEFYDWKTLGQLRADGFDVPDDIASTSDDNLRSESVELARDLYSEKNWEEDGEFEDASMRRVRVRYIWIRHDYDGDGINELQYVVRIGDEVLYRRECEEIPVASISPIPLAHRHIGMSLADSVADIEDINTNITRQAIDNLNLSNTPRIAVSDRVNMADLLDVRVGGVIRVDGQPPQEFLPVEVPNVFPNAVQALTFFDSRRQNRTGINAYFQGTDANALNKTASGISQLTNSAAQRVEMIARLFATGVERLFLITHRLILQHGHSEEVVRLRNKWVTVDPAQWRKRNDVRIAVGLGTGNKDSLLAQLGAMFQTQMAAAPLGIVQPQNVYATLLEMAKAASFATPERFVTDPATIKPQPQQPPLPLVIEQMKAQVDVQTTQADNQLKAAQAQLNAQTQTQLEQMRLAYEKWKTEFQASVDLQIAAMKEEKATEREMTKLSSSTQIEGLKMQREDAKEARDAEKEGEVGMSIASIGQQVQQLSQMLGGSRVAGVERIKDPKTGRMTAARIKRADGSVEEVPIQ